MIPATQIRKGMILNMEGQLFKVMDYQHITPGNWRAIIHTKLRNIATGNQKELRLSSSDKVDQAFLDEKEMEYLYNDGENYFFMDTESYEQISIPKDFLESVIPFMKENDKVQIELYEDKPVGVDIANIVELEVTYTEPGAKGNTATNVTKPATTETGYELNVPIFVTIGDRLRIDTRTGEYIERAK
ncbi:MAG: elongation factor P [Candidatus Wallbacteria bacterium HGW-Wallbacteria-1]|uniref:Elongation factor P n=1 Tax=Candidatus Wallbacteria bacterium HGW-Wallbacteria-1 TaxID=2013854 RepID=A0A2N1PSJ4_9BACT|nr:MAG: elongation factor P [Candidatus Wallbacteria bacterium HGW-Wallbacteria-1]